MSRKGISWYLHWIMINAFLFVICLFLTTPTYIVEVITNWNTTDPLKEFLKEKSPFIASYLPTLLLWTFSALIPLIVWYAGYWEKHWSISSTHYNICQKAYGFLLLMVLIMPSLGLGALSILLERLFDKEHPNEGKQFEFN